MATDIRAHDIPSRLTEHEHPYQHILERDGYTCQLCGSRRSLQVHHIRLRSRGGGDEDWNLVTLCRNCHAQMH